MLGNRINERKALGLSLRFGRATLSRAMAVKIRRYEVTFRYSYRYGALHVRVEYFLARTFYFENIHYRNTRYAITSFGRNHRENPRSSGAAC